MRKIRNGIVFGVCGGIGKSLGIGIALGELIGIILFFSTSWFWAIYFLLAYVLEYEEEN